MFRYSSIFKLEYDLCNGRSLALDFSSLMKRLIDRADSPLVTAGCAVLSSSLMVSYVFPSSTFWSINSLIPGMELSTAGLGSL